MRSSSMGRRENRVGVVSLGKSILRRYTKEGRGYPGVPRVREKLRVASNAGLILGQSTLLFLSRDIGLCIIILSSLLSFPYFLQHRMWDVVALMVFMNIVNFVGLLVK